VRGCAVAYTDKGTGTGAHDLQNDRGNLIDGLVVSAADAGEDSIFTVNLSPAELALFNVATPNRSSFMHAHRKDTVLLQENGTKSGVVRLSRSLGGWYRENERLKGVGNGPPTR
jgi:hypothetical protein